MNSNSAQKGDYAIFLPLPTEIFQKDGAKDGFMKN